MKRLLEAARGKFVRDAVTLQVGALLNAAAGILSSLVLAKTLGAHLQGAYVVAFSLYSLFFMLLNMGLVTATVSQVAAASAKGQTGKVEDWLAFLVKAYGLLGALLFAGGYFLLPWLADAWWEPEQAGVEPHLLGVWAWWLCAIPLLDVPRVTAVAAFQGTRRMLALAQTENVTELVRMFLVIVGAVVTGSPAGPVLGCVLASAAGSVLGLFRYRRARLEDGPPLPHVREILAGVRHIPLRQGLALGLKLGVLRTVDSLSMRILPPLIIQTFGSSAWVAYFRIAQTIMNMPFLMMQGISRAALPALSRLAGVRDPSEFRRQFTRITLMGGGLIGLGVLLCLPLIPMLLVTLDYPPDYREPVWILSLILAVGFVSASFAVALDSFYIVTNQLKNAIRIGVLGLITTVPASALLAAELPRTGAAWGTVVSMAWGFVHYGYIAWWFRAHRSEVEGAAA